jgi:NADPH:quinone reductase-like Zn-dependent oxidoreductase
MLARVYGPRMSETMDAIVLREHGGPEVLRAERIPKPEPGPGQVRVKVGAVALNHMDLWVRKGGPAFKLSYPHRLGCDIAGTVDGVGAGVTGIADGARVVVQPGLSCGVCAACLGGCDNLCREYKILGENAQGGYAQWIVVPRANIAAMPPALTDVEAASVLLPFLTAWQMVTRKARVSPGEVVLVQGAGSGVGVAAIQIAKLHGARVIATAGSDDKLDRARALGADDVINYQTDDFAAIARKLTDKRGVDVVIEHVGGDTFVASIKAVRNGGKIVTCGATSGFTPAIDLRHIFFRQIEVLGSTMGAKSDLLRVLEHVSAGKLKPVVHKVLPLADAAEAHRILEAREAFGKVVLVP